MNENETKNAFRKVPAAALRFNAGECRFAAGDGDDNEKSVPIEIVARSGEPISHWYWGRVVHDLAGMQLHKPTLPCDYCHDWADVIGYLDEFVTESGALVCRGRITPFTDTDRASEIVAKCGAGVPYEASIDFGGGQNVVEEVDEGVEVEINGRKMFGPLTVFRKWNLRGVAVCPYGADMNTNSKMTDDREVAVSILQTQGTEKMEKMADKPEKKTEEAAEEKTEEAVDEKTEETTEEATEEKTEEKTEEPTKEAPAELSKLVVNDGEIYVSVKSVRAEVGRYAEAFGADNGVKWFAEGLTFAEAMERHAAAMKAENADLQKKLAAATADRGLKDPVEFSAAGDESEAEKRELAALVDAFDGDEDRARAAFNRRRERK